MVACLLLARPAHGQRLADLAPVYIARPYLAPEQWRECSVVTRAGWALGGAIVGTMASMFVIALTVWDRGPSSAGRREFAIVASTGAVAGGIYGWFVLADRYSCG